MVILSSGDLLEDPDTLIEAESWEVCEADELADLLALVEPELLIVGAIVLVPVDGSVIVTVIDWEVETVSVRFTNVSVSVDVANGLDVVVKLIVLVVRGLFDMLPEAVWVLDDDTEPVTVLLMRPDLVKTGVFVWDVLVVLVLDDEIEGDRVVEPDWVLELDVLPVLVGLEVAVFELDELEE